MNLLMNSKVIALLSALIGMAWLYSNISIVEASPPVDFTRQIRPILSNKCFLCHGPDEEVREADLRLDQEASAIEDRGGYAAIVPGNPAASELIVRITTDDHDMIMPPVETENQLSAEEIDLLKRWISEGAQYARHWAFIAPVRPNLPIHPPAGQEWVRNPIDTFVLAKLEQAGLGPSPAADRVTLLRRLHLDLTGLPPSLEEKEAFLQEDSLEAYEKLAQRLLASPHYGERWAQHWLDAARYADSDGYEKDLQRTMWFYRDWVINAFNKDKPYNDFIIEQIAGDMLPNATDQQRIATGYLRSSMVNEEGGADPEQFRVEGLFDRMDAIGKGILGITTQCAQCHTHKYDPLTHAEYYGMFAFLNNCVEASFVAFTDEEQTKVDRILSAVNEIEESLKSQNPDWKDRIHSWALEVRGDQPRWQELRPEILSFDGQKFRLNDDNSIVSEGYAPVRASTTFQLEVPVRAISGVRLELLTNPGLPANGPGRSTYGTGALSEFNLSIEPVDGSQSRTEVKWASVTADVNPIEIPLPPPYFDGTIEGGDKRTTGPVAFAIDGNSETAWTTDSGPATRNQSRKAVFVPENTFGFPQGTQLIFTLNHLHGGKHADRKQNYLMGCFRFSITTDPHPLADPLPAAIRELVELKDSRDWTDEELAEVFSYWRTIVPEYSEQNQEIEELYKGFPAGSVQLVVQQRDKPRTTHRLERGDFLSPAEEIQPSVPAFLNPLPTGSTHNRLDFAHWMVDRNAPTTARALVNRVWQEYFGTGLVETSEDLGSQAPPASHPELLDWLAVEFMDSGWNLKHLHRLIVNSATYQQSSHITPQLANVDPRNRMLARGPRVRVDAELVRDISLAVSGLLNDQIGGRSVYPPAPEFLFLPPASYGPKNWFTEDDDQKYRRSMYVHAYRSVPYPPLQMFDAPKGDFACVRRVRSNTPLQALTLLNEDQFVECSQALAERVLEHSPSTDRDLIDRAFQLCLTRNPDEKEMELLLEQLERSRKFFRTSPEQARIVAGIGEDGNSDNLAAANSAAWTVIGRILLNLDETITKQ